MTGSKLQQILAKGQFAVTAECGPPRGANADVVREKGCALKGYADAVNVTDNQTAIVRMSSIAAAAQGLDESSCQIAQHSATAFAMANCPPLA